MRDRASEVRDATFSILRERIANSTVLEIIRNRHKIRDVMKKELNKLVNNWGVWIENVEITDVRVLSNELFKFLGKKGVLQTFTSKSIAHTKYNKYPIILM